MISSHSFVADVKAAAANELAANNKTSSGSTRHKYSRKFASESAEQRNTVTVRSRIHSRADDVRKRYEIKKLKLILAMSLSLWSMPTHANDLNQREAGMAAIDKRITEFRGYMLSLAKDQSQALITRAYLKDKSCFDDHASSDKWIVFCTLMGTALTCVQDDKGETNRAVIDACKWLDRTGSH